MHSEPGYDGDAPDCDAQISNEAIAAVRSLDQVLGFEHLIESGLLWWINKQAFHPLGRMLELSIDPATGFATGFRIVGDGYQAITHDPDLSLIRHEQFLATMIPTDEKPEVDWFGEHID